MKLAGEHTFPVARERLWQALLDPTLLARVLPGCEPLEPAGDGPDPAWRAAMTLQVGPVKGRFQGTLALAELDPPSGYRMKIDGSGPAGFLRGEGRITLAEATATSTTLAYEVDAQVGGKLASVGQRLVESSARSVARQGLEGLERELAAREAAAAAAGTRAPGAPPAPGTAGAPPSTAVFAGRVARGVWRELPASWRWTALAAGALILALLALWIVAD